MILDVGDDDDFLVGDDVGRFFWIQMFLQLFLEDGGKYCLYCIASQSWHTF